MNRETILLIITIILSIAGIYYLYRYKKESLWVIACYVVTRAEEGFASGQGKQKLEYAIKEFKKKIPFYLSWLISEKFIISLIEEALKTFQKTFKSSKDKQLIIVNEILKTATTGATKDILKVAGEMQQDIKSKGYIEGYLEGRTDFKGNSNLVGGVKAGIKL
ncbi:hypothetical protein DXA30_02575 [Fusobacterium ulcerans]|uniref:hypothetical protein n=1 Tax=Fusobacterium ulcerans TaxID=861 RepID=UPI000E53089B|nr:hypothetical protein [Fusobacterium ulcerans]RGY66657.1 hypothetical protein DXA30_02575 [Fusobacterium ulcerans]